jgi:hypothetical protein
MNMNRREMFTGVLAGAGVAVFGGTLIGWAVAPKGAEAAPIGIPRPAGVELHTLVEKAQVVVVNPGRRRGWGRRRRQWVCWWRRGRRVCGWR